MSLIANMIPEFDYEMASTRRVLERVPENKLAWAPHPKSYTLAGLTTHIAHSPIWTLAIMHQDQFDVDAPDAPPPVEPKTSVAAILSLFDESVAAARGALVEARDDRLLAVWSFIKGGRVLFAQPRIAVLRSFILSHTIHHRGQLSVYLRLCDVPLPAIYGPSADEDIN